MCEFSGAVAERIADSGRSVLACDRERRESTKGLYCQGDVQDIASAYPWARCVAHPPCEHQALSSAPCMLQKALDGRLFWGCAFVLWCECLGQVNLTEQPGTFYTVLAGRASQAAQPFHFGDDRQKATHFFMRGVLPEGVHEFSNFLPAEGSFSARKASLPDSEDNRPIATHDQVGGRSPSYRHGPP